MWRGDEIFYLAQPLAMVAVSVTTKNGFSRGNPVKLFSGPYSAALNGRTHDATDDERGFLMVKGSGLVRAGRWVRAFTLWRTGSRK